MPTVFVPGFSATVGAQHSTYAMYVDPKLGFTAENVDGTSIGQKLQYAQDHITRYRYNGPCFLANRQVSPGRDDVTWHVIIHYPPQTSGENRNLAFVFVYSHGDPLEPGYLEWADGFTSTTWTRLVEFAGGNHYGTFKKILSYAPPTGNAGASFKVLKFRINNCIIYEPSMYNIGERITDVDDIKIDAGDCSAGMIVSATDHSITGLLKQVGTGANDEPSMERLTRRVFWNQTESYGIQITDGGATWQNMFDVFEWQARCRNLLGNDAAINCYPAMIVKAHGHIAHDATIKIRYKSYDAGVDWTYTFGAADAEDTYLLLQPWRTGSSSSDGLPVYSNGHQTIFIEGQVDETEAGTPDSSLTLYGWALFEGPAW